MTLADNSLSTVFSKKVVISIFSPLLIAPKSGTPAISSAKRMHLVQ